jgi:hypothetical protein
LVVLGVEEGWGDPRALASLRVRAVEAPDAAGRGTGEEATALVAAGGAADGADAVPYRFRREAGRWRLDLARLARDAEPALGRSLAALAERAGLDDGRAVLVLAVQSGSGHLVERDLWAPLLPPVGDR